MSRRIVRILVAFVVVVTTFGCSFPSIAASSSLSVAVRAVHFSVNGQEKTPRGNAFFNGQTYVPDALYTQGTTYVPLRLAAILLGKAIAWESATQTIALSEGSTTEVQGPGAPPKLPSTVTTTEKQVHFTVDGVDKTPNPPVFNNGLANVPLALYFNGTTYVPLRFAANLLGVSIEWIGTTSTISLQSGLSVGVKLSATSATPTQALAADASVTGAPAGDTLRYQWSIKWPDGTILPIPGAGDAANVSLALPENAPDGQYTVELQVYDATAGTSGTGSVSLTVSGTAPQSLQVPTGYFVPTNILSAYDINALQLHGAQGAGEHIALFESGSINPTDLQTFDQAFGLPPAQVNTYYGSGGSNAAPLDETTMDVEWIHAIAPLATIDIYVVPIDIGGSDFFNRLMDSIQQAVQAGDKIVSVSYGTPPSGGWYSTYGYSWTDTADQQFAQFAKQGDAIFASSGDQGPATGYYYDSWPAADPNVIAVGGTSLSKDSSGNWVQSFWNEGGGSGNYGTTDYPQAPWQASWVNTSNLRAYPDVSFLADPVTGVAVYFQGSWQEFGGTSLGAPSWAALWADFDQYDQLVNGHGIQGNPAQLIYQLAGQPNANTMFLPANGKADNTRPVTYDQRTGLGTPDAWNLAQGIAALK